MNESRQAVESEKATETPAREPFFRRYQIKIKAGLRVGPAPTGTWPIGF
jgi:hypothetical protein